MKNKNSCYAQFEISCGKEPRYVLERKQNEYDEYPNNFIIYFSFGFNEVR